jgi:hypothetical protein
MGGKKKLLGRDNKIAALRKRMIEELWIDSGFHEISPQLEKKLAQASEYGDFRRVENERQLESIKAILSGYIFDENVVVQGTVLDKNGGERVVELSRFDVLMKAINIFLSALNMQNKMWGIYAEVKVPRGPSASEPAVVFSKLVAEMQRIAKKPIPALPAGASDTRPVNNRPPDPDSR